MKRTSTHLRHPENTFLVMITANSHSFHRTIILGRFFVSLCERDREDGGGLGIGKRSNLVPSLSLPVVFL